MKCLSKCVKLYFFRKKKSKKLCVPILPKIFRPVTLNTLIFLFGLYNDPVIFRYGVQDLLILSPALDIEAILSESKVKLLLSSVSIALSEAGW